MANKKQGATKNGKADSGRGNNPQPKALEFSERGIATGADFANVMSALMADLIAGRVTPQVGNAVCNVGGKLLKIVEMQHRYGTVGDDAAKMITLAKPKPAITT